MHRNSHLTESHLSQTRLNKNNLERLELACLLSSHPSKQSADTQLDLQLITVARCKNRVHLHAGRLEPNSSFYTPSTHMSPSLPLSPHISWKRRYRHWRQRDHRLTPPSPDYSSSAGVHTHTRACTAHRADCSYGRAQVALSVGHKLVPPCKQEHTQTG